MGIFSQDPFAEGGLAGSGLGRSLDPLGAKVYDFRNKKSAPQSTFAQDTYAAVTKDQWYNYLNSIGAPQEKALQQFATDPNVVTNNMAEASKDVNGAFDRQAVNTQRNLSSLGLSLTPEEQQVADRSSNLSRSLADVNAQNMTRRATRGLQQSILGNPAPQIGAPV